jgi:hypothetical protein
LRAPRWIHTGLILSVCLIGLIVPGSPVTAQGHRAVPPPTPCEEELPNVGPCARQAMGVAFDPDHNRIVLFGGKAGDPQSPTRHQVGDTWLFDGSTWIKPTALTDAPCAMHSTRMVWDANIHRVVLFGGQIDSMPVPPEGCLPGLSNATWTWDGTDWHLEPTGLNTPPARASHSLAWDGVVGRVVMFGGNGLCDSSQPGIAVKCADTWFWDGTGWT